MVRKAMRSLVALAVLPALPATTSAQVQSWQEVQVGDIETIKGKRIALAGVFGEPDFDWRPMDGVHSVREGLGLAITEANLFPGAWGAGPGPGAAQGFAAEFKRTAAVPQADIVAALETSVDYMLGVVRDINSAARTTNARYFDGTEMEVHAHISMALGDIHEHLCQLIAYTRTNHCRSAMECRQLNARPSEDERS